MASERPPILVVRRGNALYALDDSAALFIQELPSGKPLKAKVTRPRSLPQHRLYWAIVQKIVDNLDGITDDEMHDWIKRQLGYVTVIKFKSGPETFVQSIAFDKMPQDEFERFFDGFLKLLNERIFPGMGAAFEAEGRAMLASRDEA